MKAAIVIAIITAALGACSSAAGVNGINGKKSSSGGAHRDVTGVAAVAPSVPGNDSGSGSGRDDEEQALAPRTVAGASFLSKDDLDRDTIGKWLAYNAYQLIVSSDGKCDDKLLADVADRVDLLAIDPQVMHAAAERYPVVAGTNVPVDQAKAAMASIRASLSTEPVIGQVGAALTAVCSCTLSNNQQAAFSELDAALAKAHEAHAREQGDLAAAQRDAQDARDALAKAQAAAATTIAPPPPLMTMPRQEPPQGTFHQGTAGSADLCQLCTDQSCGGLPVCTALNGQTSGALNGLACNAAQPACVKAGPIDAPVLSYCGRPANAVLYRKHFCY
jgi:hypothetical protein